ncbi:Acyl-homoserine lactone acylase QuiP precursor [Posidoniimonas corsicana]|uniref:Acyl-homoserine lactone acylase QuiP n=1 Tax=Posidoniimonas corsicana TaxID=1938618 RepID=A0A5C5VE60_9BACT|nr:penicillin acylase family protein [Posidoniimonas corsicana]TWT36898.1 Acyl-homoserine lactone acylase QuiP precursor [Posidoniimonas corsicana]
MEAIQPKAARYDFRAERDAAGVPHVHASSWRHALYALGYLHALDRPTQIHFARAVASGVASERIANKPELLEMDLFLRRAGIHLRLDYEAKLLPPRVLQQLEWYCQGLNDGMLESADAWIGPTLPMWVTGYRPAPWDVESVMLIGNLLSFAGLAVGEQEAERQLLELIQLGIPDERLRELFSPYLDGIDFEPLRDIHVSKRLSDEALELLSDLPRLAGSNAWAVSPARSASGGALLASDPHLEVNRLPAIWYEVALNWGDSPEHEPNYALGATLPGCPLMAVGRTRRLSWGVTYMHADTSDYFIEDCRPGGQTGWQYRRGEDQWHDFRLRTESLKPKGGERIEMPVYENDVGVLTLAPEEPGKHLSVAWIGSHQGGGRAIGTWLDVIAAGDAAEAMDIVRESPHPSLVWVFADSQGHIGSQASGWHPRRRPGVGGFVPMPAWEESNHWLGVVPADLMPREYDPPIGFVASANEELYRKDGPPLHAFGLADYRKRRIVQRLTELPQATLADMQALQYDVTSLQAEDLLPVLLAHVGDCPLKRRLEKWDRRYNLESTEATLFMHFYRHVLLEIFGHEEGIGWRRMFYLTTRMGFSRMVLTAADRMLRKVTSSWWRVRDKGEMIRRAAERAAAEPEQPWAQVNRFHFVNRFFGASMTGRLLGIRTTESPMPGNHATPFQGHLLQTATREATFAPSYHFVTDMSENVAHTNLPGGPSENAFSKWYQTDIALWTSGRYKPLAPGGPGE